MFLPGRGFAMYPGSGHPSDSWSPLAVSHLWQLAPLLDVAGLPSALKEAVGRALSMADDAGRDALNDEGRLYSTVDSAAAVALFSERARHGVGQDEGNVVANGKAMTTTDALALGDQVETVRCHNGVAVVEVTTLRQEHWDDFRADTAVRIGLRDDDGRSVRRFKKGQRATLHIALEEAYQEGDLVHVCLPPCMSRLVAGGQEQRFTADFEGKTSVEVPVRVTGALDGEQRWAVALRNMFKEERSASSGLLTVAG